MSGCRLAKVTFAIGFAFFLQTHKASAQNDQCIHALDRTAAYALTIYGSASLTASGCGVLVDSSANAALNFSGSGSLTAKYINVAGGYSAGAGASFSPVPQTHAPPQLDPLSFLTPPASTACNYTNTIVNGTSATLNPGTYCNGITIGGAAIVTFNPGTYILMGGGLNVTGAAILNGNGVTFFLTQGLGYTYGPLATNSSSVLALSAPATGPYAGILFYQDPAIGQGQAGSTATSTAVSVVDGTLYFTLLQGVLYFPTTSLTYAGSTAEGSCLILVADTIQLTGSAAFKNTCPNGSPLQPPVVAAPTFTPAAGTYSSTQSVTIATATAGASIRYTTDGSTPSETAGMLYSGPITVTAATTITAIAYMSSMTDSAVTTAAYTMAPPVTMPTFTPAAGTYLSTQTVAIATSTAGASIRYTTDGSIPSETAGTLYTTPVTVAATGTIKAIAYMSGMADSAVAVALYTIAMPVAAPTFTPAAGQYSSTQTVAIATATTGASIRYTTDGSTPSETAGTLYSAPVTVSSTSTINAIAYKSGMTDSAVAAAAYTIGPAVAAPTFTPAAGTYNSSQTVTIATTTAGASIRYTTDGSTPSETAGTLYSAPVTVAATSTINAIAYKTGMIDSPVSTAAYAIGPAVAAPTFTPAAGTYNSTQTVTIATTTAGASIRYTTDGSTPSETAGTLYSAPVTVSATATINAIAYKSGMTDSTVSTAAYTIGPAVAAPTFTPAAGTYNSTQTVTIATATAGASIRYTTDGSTPSETAGTSYSAPVTVSATATINAIAYKSGMTDSSVSTAAYTIGAAVAAPTFTPAAGTYNSTQTVTIATATTGASIRYTTNGNTPSETAGTLYSAPVTVSASSTIKAIAYKTGMPDSAVATAAYTIAPVVAAPTFTPAAGTYISTQTVTIATASAGASIRYTTDGSTPSETAGTLYSTPVTVAANTTINAIAYKTGMTDSTVATAAYIIAPPVAAPTLTPAAGSYTSTQTVTIATATAGASIRYTTDGSTPSETAGTLYSAPVTVSATTTINAIAYKTGMTDSTVATAAYTIIQAAATPSFSPAAGTYTSTQTVTIATATQGASIRFTEGGSSPSETAGILYTGPVTVNSTATIKAIAYKTGLADSTVASAVYVITPATAAPTFTPAAGTYNSTQTVTIATATAGGSIRYTTDGSTPSETAGTLYGSPVTVSATTTIKAIAYKSGMADSTVVTAAYTIIPSVAPPTFSPAAGTYTSTQTVTIATTTAGASIRYTTDGSKPSETAGTLYSGPVLVGANVTINAIAYESGMADSTVATAAYTINQPVAAPTFTPPAGSYTSAQTVTIASATAGASIRYTVDGSTPSETAGTLYSAPVTINATTTLKAIAYKTGLPDSTVATAVYTVNLTVATPTFTPPAGTYSGTQTVTIATATPGASIRYTTDGSAPSETVGTLYSAPVTVNTSTTIKAIAYKSGLADSAVNAAAYALRLSVTVAPASATLSAGQTQTFTATVTNTSNPAVTWSSAPAGAGAINPASGVYTAPLTIAAQKTVTITATSQVDGVTTGAATVTLMPPIAVTLTPATATLSAGQSQQFTATVANATNQGVTWTLTPTGFGTISATGLYTAPASIAAAESITVTAASGAASASAQIQLSPCALSPYSHVRAIVIDHTKVPNTDQVNFPVLFSGTYSYLATVANGGYVQSPEGYDIVFTSDMAGTNKLDHEVESYDPTTGAITAWVRIPTLSHTADTVIYLNYGSSAIAASQENPTGVWDSSYEGVWHFVPTTGGSVDDSTYNGNNASFMSGNGFATGLIGGVVSFATGDSYIQFPNTPSMNNWTAQSISFWVNAQPYSTASTAIGALIAKGSNEWALFFNEGLVNGVGVEPFDRQGSIVGALAQTSGAVADNTWHKIDVTISSSSYVSLFVDGALNAGGQSPAPSTTTGTVILGGQVGMPFLVDELRLSNIARSADWLAAEYANENSPATFYTVYGDKEIGLVVTPGTSVVGAGNTQQFTTTSIGACGGAGSGGAGSSAIAWSLVPNVGSIDASGLYTAPIRVAEPQIVTVQASMGGTSNLGTASITLVPAGVNHYLYRRTIVINHSKVPNTDQANFPVLISGTYSYLANAANGGHVQNSKGYDILFASDCAGLHKLNYEIESYNPATGAIDVWVSLPNVSHTTDTVFYILYGNADIATSQANPTAVWDSNFQMVLHLSETAAPYKDSTVNAYSSTGGISPTAAAGKIGGGQSFDGLKQFIAYSQSESPNPTGAISMEAWIKTSDGASKGVLGKWANDGTGSAHQSYELFYQANGQPGGLLNSVGGTSVEASAMTAISDGNWHHVAVVAPTTGTITIYVDGAPAGSLMNSQSLLAPTADRFLVGATAGTYTAGLLDEIRISNAVRSADWIATEFANENSPATFYSVSPENIDIGPSPINLPAYRTRPFPPLFTTGVAARSCRVRNSGESAMTADQE